MKKNKLLLKIALCCILCAGITACEKEQPKQSVPKWEIVQNLSNRNFRNACVFDDKLVLLSLDSVVCFDKSLQQIQIHFIEGIKDRNFAAPFVLDNQEVIVTPVYANHAGKLDSLAIYFYNLKNNKKTIFDYSQIPEIDKNGYVATDMMSNYDNKFSIVLTRFDAEYIYPESNNNTSFAILNIDFSDIENLNYSVNNNIYFPKNSHISPYNLVTKRNFINYKNKYYISTPLYGTFIVDENGFKEEQNGFYFLNSDVIYQISNQYLKESNDGENWNIKTTFDDVNFWNIEYDAKLYESSVLRFNYALSFGSADMVTGKTKLLNSEGLPSDYSDFLIEYDNYLYLGILGNIFRIKKSEFFN
ncbi:MAG: hypothetical protein LBN95_05610 [Prevotellaceae bacterium]|jgi:hypothetical protein|nr:hypothetical protein [Prevotellaceae bacterium]